MTPGPGTRPSRCALDPSRTRAHLDRLEEALGLVRRDQDGQAAAVEEELRRLQAVYAQMSSDVEGLRTERDLAVLAAREERERRARETLELSEKLDAARLRQEGDGAPSPDVFVAARLAEGVPERVQLMDGEMPTVPGYRVVAPLGQGGMATVYHAVRERDGREVAIKLLHDGADASPARTELFLREAAVMLQLSHPGLIRALDAGDCAQGRFLVLELIRGESLSAFVRTQGPLSEKDAIRVALQVARALAYCARLGLTHRDVKPSNLLTDATGRVRLCDFGLAALSCGSDPARAYGSPGYAAPEQINNPTSIDESVDIYALGATIWHLVVGRRPFHGAPAEVFEAQRMQDLSDPRFDGADISPRLAQVVRRMGRADRERRYRRWDACILDLMLVENGNPPFSAHLAEALEPGAAPSATREPATAPAVPQTPTTARPASSPERPAAPRRDIGLSRESLRGREDVLAPDDDRIRAPWLLIISVCLANIALGFGAATLSRPNAAMEIEGRARLRADAGDAAGAAAALRAAAELFDGEERARLLRLAASVESRSAPK